MKILDQVMGNKGAYIRKLGELLEQEEKKLEEKKSDMGITKNTDDTDVKDVENKNSHFENLNMIFTIFKNLFAIADQNLIELLMSDDLYLITFGALECKN